MKLELCEKRQAILDQDGALLVQGGPGSGKTTIALLKAKHMLASLKPGQEILFLSFSRAAIRQVLLRCKDVLSVAERRLVSVMTYHAFCMDMLQTHGRLLRGKSTHFIYPGDERLLKSGHQGNWERECRRLAEEEGRYSFELFAAGAADLLEGSESIRKLIADKFPMIIIDEFQDTDDDQWRMVRALGTVSRIFCLSDPDQRIFDYRPKVSSQRIDMYRSEFAVTEFDLAGENHRSPNSSILAFADAVLRVGPKPASTADVKQIEYFRMDQFAPLVHAAVIWTFSQLRSRDVNDACVAVLCRSNSFVADISNCLRESHQFQNQQLQPVVHDVAWDAELSIAAAVVVATILEWHGTPASVGVAKTLRSLSGFYKLKNAEKPTASAAELARKFEEAELVVLRRSTPRTQAARSLVSLRDGNLFAPVGDPVSDWLLARELLNSPPFQEVFQAARLVRLFGASDTIGAGLAERWLGSGTYAGAATFVRRSLEQERLVAADRDPRGCIVMTMHKAKGKEYDGVVLVEGRFKSKFFDERAEQQPYERSRRLLRVAITRARKLVTIVRPRGAIPLFDV